MILENGKEIIFFLFEFQFKYRNRLKATFIENYILYFKMCICKSFFPSTLSHSIYQPPHRGIESTEYPNL